MAKEIWTLDCETDPFQHGRIPLPFIWGAYNGETFVTFETENDVVEFFYDRDVIIYAHNGGKFDYHYLIPFMEAYTDITIINGRLSKFFIGSAEYRDSYNVLPMPLAAYKKDDFDYTILEKSERDKPGNRTKILDYLRNDCIYLYELVTEFVTQYGNRLTLASAAMHYFEKMALYDKAEMPESEYDILKPYYIGGRCQVFKRGAFNKRHIMLDINSAYPHAMMRKHPYGNILSISDELPENDIELCFIKLRCNGNGLFPLRDRNGSISFPTGGEHVFHVSGYEYATAEQYGLLNNAVVLEVIEFETSISFKRYITHFYDMKKSAKPGTTEYIFAKLFMNSLYGKFAQDPRKNEKLSLYPVEFADQIEETPGLNLKGLFGDIGKLVVAGAELPHLRFYNIGTAASITGFVRAYMFESMQRCVGVAYCDTDSILCKRHNLKLGNELGQWSVDAVVEHGAIAGKKLYALKTGNRWKTASKGGRLKPHDIIKVAKGDVYTYCNDAPTFNPKAPPVFIKRQFRSTSGDDIPMF